MAAGGKGEAAAGAVSAVEELGDKEADAGTLLVLALALLVAELGRLVVEYCYFEWGRASLLAVCVPCHATQRLGVGAGFRVCRWF